MSFNFKLILQWSRISELAFEPIKARSPGLQTLLSQLSSSWPQKQWSLAREFKKFSVKKSCLASSRNVFPIASSTMLLRTGFEEYAQQRWSVMKLTSVIIRKIKIDFHKSNANSVLCQQSLASECLNWLFYELRFGASSGLVWFNCVSILFSLQVESFLYIIDVAGGPEVERYFPDSRFERLQIHCAAAGYHLNLARGAKDTSAKTASLNQATTHLNKAITIDYNEQLPMLGLGQVALEKVFSFIQASSRSIYACHAQTWFKLYVAVVYIYFLDIFILHCRMQSIRLWTINACKWFIIITNGLYLHAYIKLLKFCQSKGSVSANLKPSAHVYEHKSKSCIKR